MWVCLCVLHGIINVRRLGLPVQEERQLINQSELTK